MTARITRLDIEGLRAIDKLSLDLRPMTVLIGENGSGKSTVLEALELLRKAATLSPEQLVADIYAVHGGIGMFRAARAPQALRVAKLGLVVDIGGRAARYELRLEANLVTGEVQIASEALFDRVGSNAEWLMVERFPRGWQVYSEPDVEGLSAMASWSGPANASLLATTSQEAWGDRVVVVRTLLETSQVYSAFESNPAWARQPGEPTSAMRAQVLLRPATSLSRGGANLPNAYHALRNRGPEVWTRVIETLQLGLGRDLYDVRTDPSASGGAIGLSVVWQSVGAVPAFALSDGQLAFMAFVAIAELEADRDGVVAFDEPDLHQHPAMIGRTVAMCERLAERRTVVIATHSDRLLDALSDPADAAVLFERGANGATIVRRPSRAWLDKWLAEYSGIGGARAEGYGSVIFTEPVGVAGS